MKTFLSSCGLLVSIAFLSAAEPKEELMAAAKKLADKSNYAWVSTPKSADGTNIRVGPTEGKTEKNGFTYFSLTVGDAKVEAAFKGAKSAINMDGSWVGVDEIPSDRDWVANRLRTFKAPAQEVPTILEKSTGLKKNDDGTFESKLTEEGIKHVIAFRTNDVTLKNSKGTAKFWLKDGLLSKYELTVEADVDFQGQSNSMKRTTTVEIKDIESTKIDLPQDAKAKL